MPPPPDFWGTDDRRKAAAILAALMVSAAGCGDGDNEQARTEPSGTQEARGKADRAKAFLTVRTSDYREFVGRIEATDIYVALVLGTRQDKTFGLFYACDGDDIAERFRIRTDGDRLRFSSAKGGSGRATIDGDTLTGSFTLANGESHDFTAESVDPDGKAGLYASDAAIDGRTLRRAGDWGAWIVLPDGSQRGNISLATQVQPGGQLNAATETARVRVGSIQALGASEFRTIHPI